MLDDARSAERARSFRYGRDAGDGRMSFDEYISFLDEVQEIFGPFSMSRQHTETAENRL